MDCGKPDISVVIAYHNREQYIDETPWDGMRFGALNPSTNGELTNVRWDRHTYDIAVGPDHLAIKRDGNLRLQATAGIVGDLLT